MAKTISTAELAKHTERIAKDVETAGTVYRIKRAGKRRLLLMDKEYFEQQIRWAEFVTRHPNWETEMEEARRELLAGRCVSHDELVRRRAERKRLAKRGSTVRGASGRRR